MGCWRNLNFLLLIGFLSIPCMAADGEEVRQVAAAIAPESQGTAIDPLNAKVERAIAATNYRVLTAGQHTPWQIVHAILGLKHDCILNTTDGKKISGLQWLATSRFHEGVPLWEKTPYGGRGHPFTKPYAFEGHPTQFLGYMCMADLPLDYKFETGDGTPITVRDIVNDAKMQLREGPEVTWTLWALAHYIPPDSEWINAYGEAWSIERMVQIQTHESVLGAACGGTHGLFVLAYARNRYIATGKPLRGVWLEADQKIRRFVQEARTMQNPDGSFSADYFQGRRYDPDFTKRLPANGHMLEWLMIALPQNDLKQDWVRRGVESVADDLYTNRKVAVDCGPLYHAVDALNLYNYRTNANSRPLGYPISGKRRLDAKTEAAAVKETPKPTETPAKQEPAPEEAAKKTEEKPAAEEPKSETTPEAEKAGTEKTPTEKPAETPGTTTSEQQPAETGTPEEKPEAVPPAETPAETTGESTDKPTAKKTGIIPPAPRPLPLAPPPPE